MRSLTPITLPADPVEDLEAATKQYVDAGGGGGAPTTADYLVGTAQAGLSAEIVVGATPGGELGGTWASPTVDATHSGTTHHAEDHASRHEDGGADEIDVTGLTGAGGGTPDAHAASHENGGSDEIDVTGLTGAGGGSSSHLWIGDPPSFAGSADKDFRGAVALTPYTAVGSDGAGTVTLHQTTTTTNIYEFTDAGLLVQVGNAEVSEFRADVTLPDTQSIVLAISGGPHLQAGDNMSIALRLNSSDTTSQTGTYVAIMLEQDSTEYVIQGNSSADTTGFEYALRSLHLPPLVLLRMTRDNLTYRGFASLNGGLSWTYVDVETLASAATDIWISVIGASTGQTVMPAVRIPFIVEGFGGDAYDPW